MKSALISIALISTIAFLYFAGPVIIPIFFSIFLAVLIDPIIERLSSFRIPRKVAIYLVLGPILLVLVVMAGAGVYSGREIALSLIHSPKIGAALNHVRESAGLVDNSFSAFSGFLKGDDGIPKVSIVDHYPVWVKWLISAFGSIFELVSFSVIVPLLLFYLLFEKENLVESANGLLGRFVYIPNLLSELPIMIRTFFRANLLTGVSLIGIHALILFALGFTNWFSLALVSGIFNVLPIIGVPLAVATIVGSGIKAGDSELPFIIASVVAMLAHFLITNFLLPILIGGRANVNATTIIVGSLFWSWLWGAVGFLIAIPMTLLIKIFLESNSATIPIANLMAARPAHLMMLDEE